MEIVAIINNTNNTEDAVMSLWSPKLHNSISVNDNDNQILKIVQ